MKMMDRDQSAFASMLEDRGTDRAVSTTIGVAIAISLLILAAAIGVFVLGIGDQQDPGPSTTLEASESTTNVTHREDGKRMGVTRVHVTVAGGEPLPIRQTRIRHAGNTSVIGRVNGENTYGNGAFLDDGLLLQMTPDLCETAGTNQQATWDAGQSYEVLWSGGAERDFTVGSRGPLPPHAAAVRSGACESAIQPYFGDLSKGSGADTLALVYASGGHAVSKAVMEGDSVGVIWQASSGGKTQQIFNYTVQQDSPLDPWK
jgi:FlaG/FlaF family flagellin (archaellin)